MVVVEEANTKATNLELELKNVKSELKALEAADKENLQLKEENSRLKIEMVEMRNLHQEEMSKE